MPEGEVVSVIYNPDYKRPTFLKMLGYYLKREKRPFFTELTVEQYEELLPNELHKANYTRLVGQVLEDPFQLMQNQVGSGTVFDELKHKMHASWEEVQNGNIALVSMRLAPPPVVPLSNGGLITGTVPYDVLNPPRILSAATLGLVLNTDNPLLNLSLDDPLPALKLQIFQAVEDALVSIMNMQDKLTQRQPAGFILPRNYMNALKFVYTGIQN